MTVTLNKEVYSKRRVRWNVLAVSLLVILACAIGALVTHTPILFGAIVATGVVTGSGILAPATPQYKSWTIAALDADTTVAIPHGFVNQSGVAIAPDLCFIQELVSYANAALPNWGVAVSTTNITLTKTGAAGSGTGLGNVAKLYAGTPDTILQ